MTLAALAAATAITSTVGFLGWIIIGGLAGALAGRVVEGKGLGLIPDVLTGVAGALIAGFIAGLFMSATIGLIGSFVLAFLGAAVLLWLLRLVTGNRAKL
jgi:uncharacterized membrane protein YeaQ/YmgE (transglycosylase-associated protein family)